MGKDSAPESGYGSQHLNREAEALIELGTLLRKQRSAEQQREVEAILDSRLGSREKVSRIRELDQRAQESSSQSSLTGFGEHEEEVGGDEARSHSSALHELKSARRNKKRGRQRSERYYGTEPTSEQRTKRRKRRSSQFNVKRPYRREGYLSFLFRHYPRIKKFGFATGTMKPAVIPPRMLLETSLRTYLEVSLKHTAKDTSTLLLQLIGNSWLHLRKKEYNLLILILDLCGIIQETDFTRFDYKDPAIIEKLKKLEQRFLTLVYHDSYMETAVEAVRTLMEKNRRHIEGIERLPGLIRSLLSTAGQSPSLSDVLLAMNMYRYRRYLTWNHLLHTGLGEVIETEVYDCSEEVQDAIDDYARRVLEKLQMLEKERKEILKLRTYLVKDENDHVKLSELQKMYEQGPKAQSYSFDHDTDKLPLFAERLADAFLVTYEDILTGPVTISDIGTVTLFEAGPFHKEVSLLHRIDMKLEDLRFQLPTFTKKRFREIKMNRAQALEVEAEVVLLLDELIEAMRSIGKKILPLLQVDITMIPQMGPDDFVPVDLRISGPEAGKLPFANFLYHDKSLEDGKNLFQVLQDLLIRCLQTRFLFEDPRIIHRLRREHQVEQEIQQNLETLERIADTEVFQNAKRNYG
jgi:hypothetical protein